MMENGREGRTSRTAESSRTTAREESTRLMIDFEKMGGLIPAMAIEVGSNEPLMLAYVNEEALRETLRSARATFYSRSRGKIWTKGESSGDYLLVEEVLIDCDQDALVYKVKLGGSGACHTRDPNSGAGRKTCFYRRIDRNRLVELR